MLHFQTLPSDFYELRSLTGAYVRAHCFLSLWEQWATPLRFSRSFPKASEEGTGDAVWRSSDSSVSARASWLLSTYSMPDCALSALPVLTCPVPQTTPCCQHPPKPFASLCYKQEQRWVCDHKATWKVSGRTRIQTPHRVTWERMTVSLSRNKNIKSGLSTALEKGVLF